MKNNQPGGISIFALFLSVVFLYFFSTHYAHKDMSRVSHGHVRGIKCVARLQVCAKPLCLCPTLNDFTIGNLN